MSNLFYHKELTDAQWNRIKFVFEEKAKVGRPQLNPLIVFNAIMWILKVERIGVIYLPVTVIGTVFITSSASGAHSVCLSDC